MNVIIKSLSTIVVLCFATSAFGEPWLASRYAQNCAACHAPGRLNVAPKDRHHTVSCQGCHTNPNGGGLRNAYGKWNEERWLRSLYLASFKLNRPKPQPTEQQWYQDKRVKNFLAGIKDPKDLAKTESEGFKLMQTSSDLAESEYNRHAPGELAMAEDPKEVILHIPQDDPWRVQHDTAVNAGVDMRFFYIDTKINGKHETGAMPMATDIGVSVTPVNKVNLVWEGRFMSDPQKTDVWDSHYSSGAAIRSAYALVDDLPYNSYAMYGIYRPMFGPNNPDHTTLFALMTGMDYQDPNKVNYAYERATYKTAGFGASPGILFFNFNYVQPFEDRSMPQDRGFVTTVGAHFVPWGSFVTLSYWHTDAKDYKAAATTSDNRQMSSLTAGFTKDRITMTADITRILRERVTVSKDTGTVVTFEPRYRFWKETYLKGGWEFSNTSPRLKQGNGNSLSAGVNTFLISGTELELMYKDLKTTEFGVNTNEKAIWLQAHLFF